MVYIMNTTFDHQTQSFFYLCFICVRIISKNANFMYLFSGFNKLIL